MYILPMLKASDLNLFPTFHLSTLAITPLLYLHHQSRGEVPQKVWMGLICFSGHPCSLLL